ncbi:hypothetical protein WJX77_007121 [Trebouxia sp. C0004]
MALLLAFAAAGCASGSAAVCELPVCFCLLCFGKAIQSCSPLADKRVAPSVLNLVKNCQAGLAWSSELSNANCCSSWAI